MHNLQKGRKQVRLEDLEGTPLLVIVPGNIALLSIRDVPPIAVMYSGVFLHEYRLELWWIVIESPMTQVFAGFEHLLIELSGHKVEGTNQLQSNALETQFRFVLLNCLTKVPELEEIFGHFIGKLVAQELSWIGHEFLVFFLPGIPNLFVVNIRDEFNVPVIHLLELGQLIVHN